LKTEDHSALRFSW